MCRHPKLFNNPVHFGSGFLVADFGVDFAWALDPPSRASSAGTVAEAPNKWR